MQSEQQVIFLRTKIVNYCAVNGVILKVNWVVSSAAIQSFPQSSRTWFAHFSQPLWNKIQNLISQKENFYHQKIKKVLFKSFPQQFFIKKAKKKVEKVFPFFFNLRKIIKLVFQEKLDENENCLNWEKILKY